MEAKDNTKKADSKTNIYFMATFYLTTGNTKLETGNPFPYATYLMEKFF